MARIFRQTYTKPIPDGAEVFTRKGKRYARFKGRKDKTITAPLSKDGTKIILEAAKYYIEYRDANGMVRKVPGSTDEIATKQNAAELERTAEHVRSGYKPKEHDQLARPLSEHLDEFKADLLAKGTSSHQAGVVHSRVKKILDGCRFTLWADISASKVQRFLAGLRRDTDEKRGLSAQTSNWYLQAIKAFCAWLVRESRAPENPVAHLRGLNVKTDRRHDRRALSDEECRHLLAAAMAGPVVQGMPGPDRALLYRTALESGLRANELRTLTIGACDLIGQPPTLTVKAGYSKHRREDVQPVPSGLAEALRSHVEGRGADEPVFPTMPPDKTARMLRADLGAAGIPYRDPAGLVVDFHALRHTYISNLARANVHPKSAMDLARHGDVNLTMARYSHTLVADRAACLADLPDLEPTAPEADELRATGTCDDEPKCTAMSVVPTSTATSPRQAGCRSGPHKSLHGQGSSFLNQRSRVRVTPGVVG